MHPVVSDPTDFKGMPWVGEAGATFLPFGDLQRLVNATKLPRASSTISAKQRRRYRPPPCSSSSPVPSTGIACPTRSYSSPRPIDAPIAPASRGFLEPCQEPFRDPGLKPTADINDWCVWAVGAGIAPEVIAFLRFRPELLCAFDPTADLTNSPLPRTWHQVSKILSLDLPRDLQIPVIQGAVGPGAGVEFVSFLRVWSDMASPDLILTAPDTAAIPTEPSALDAVVTAIAMRVQKDSMTRRPPSRYLERLCGADRGEFAAVVA